MKTHKLLFIPVIAMLIATAMGCEEDQNKRLVEMAERHLKNQAEQSRRMADLQKEVAEGTRRLVEADAQSRKEMVALQREVGQQRDALEEKRRETAAKRRMDPIIATAITQFGLLLACLLPLALCWHLLRRPVEPADDTAVAELLLEDLVTDRPLLLPAARHHRTLGHQAAVGKRNPDDVGDSDDLVPLGSG
ncbi:MAG: hypothetical protein DWQ35_12095 [Planctomycetota bacterium]|nr:MAG: hypothetical protein DWQ35_12095 [Planctomycetota bacterium]REK30366.1 MAG: hypothetical protein DWQ42_01780 [Planctomycetota bacterium]REK40249.1 MAG: hypothetical protein DWQ46_16825 [Planctomycetota bacterium]